MAGTTRSDIWLHPSKVPFLSLEGAVPFPRKHYRNDLKALSE